MDTEQAQVSKQETTKSGNNQFQPHAERRPQQKLRQSKLATMTSDETNNQPIKQLKTHLLKNLALLRLVHTLNREILDRLLFSPLVYRLQSSGRTRSVNLKAESKIKEDMEGGRESSRALPSACRGRSPGRRETYSSELAESQPRIAFEGSDLTTERG